MEMGRRVGFLLLITLKKEQQLWAQGPWERDRGASFEELHGWQVQKGEPAPGDLKEGIHGSKWNSQRGLGWGRGVPACLLIHSSIHSFAQAADTPGSLAPCRGRDKTE